MAVSFTMNCSLSQGNRCLKHSCSRNGVRKEGKEGGKGGEGTDKAWARQKGNEMRGEESEKEWSQMAAEPRKCWGQGGEIPAPHTRVYGSKCRPLVPGGICGSAKCYSINGSKALTSFLMLAFYHQNRPGRKTPASSCLWSVG